MDFSFSSVLWGLLWFVLGSGLTALGLSVAWRAEQNKWLSFFGFDHEVPWYGFVAVIVAGLVSAFFWYIQPEANALALFLQIIILATLVITFVSDIHFGVINLPVLGAGSMAVLVGIGWQFAWVPTLLSALAAAVIAAVFFLWQYVFSRGQWVGIGDAWLGAFLGLLAGWHDILIVAAAGYGLAALVAFAAIIIFRQRNLNRLPLGAFLSLASLAFFLVTSIK